MPVYPAYYDLSQPIHDQMAVFPGDPPVRLTPRCQHPDDPFQLLDLHLGSHTGTHLDVPRHFWPDGLTIETMTLDRFCGPARVINLPAVPGKVLDLVHADLTGWQPGEALLLATGWEAKAGSPAYFEHLPLFAAGTAAWLLDRQIRLLGVDLPTVQEEDRPGQDWRHMHLALLQSGVVIVEGLVGLQPLIQRRVEFFAVPLSIVNGDGSPVRAFARDY